MYHSWCLVFWLRRGLSCLLLLLPPLFDPPVVALEIPRVLVAPLPLCLHLPLLPAFSTDTGLLPGSYPFVRDKIPPAVMALLDHMHTSLG